MKIFNYHPVTKEFISEAVADKDPRNAERVLIPSYATDLPVPSVKENEVAQFVNDEWSVSPDYRGTEYWLNDEKHTIENIGDTVPDNASLTEPEPTETEKMEREAEKVRAERDRLLGEVSDRYDRYYREQRMNLPFTDDISALDQYAQELADIPEKTGFPFEFEWPEYQSS